MRWRINMQQEKTALHLFSTTFETATTAAADQVIFVLLPLPLPVADEETAT